MLRRHELLGVSEGAWQAVQSGHPVLTSLPAPAGQLVVGWARNGWPVMVRRPLLSDAADTIPAALPLPPEHGKLRLAFSLPKAPAPAARAPVLLHDARQAAPGVWQRTIASLIHLGEETGSPPRVFGALLWQRLTGLPYLSSRSDLDLLWVVSDRQTAAVLLPVLRHVEATAPMRLDGEVVLPDGAGVNWRELADAMDRQGGDVLVKTMHGIETRPICSLFINSEAER